jgi:hypothetical protein
VRVKITFVMALGLGANGLFMLFAPESWYGFIPGVRDTGPSNLHFIRDVGCAYLVAAASFFWLAGARTQAWPAALAGGVFLSLHAGVHIWDTVRGREAPSRLAGELPTVLLPAALALVLALPPGGTFTKRGVRRCSDGG